LQRNPNRKEEKAEKTFLFMAQLLRKMNLVEIFSEARSGTIAHKNRKRITAGTQYHTSYITYVHHTC